MIHNPSFSFKGLTIDATANVTGVYFDNPLVNVSATVTFYTDQSCQYSFDQRQYTLDTGGKVNDDAIFQALLLLPDFSGWSLI